VPGALNVRQIENNIYEVEAEHDVRAEAAGAVIKAKGRLIKLDVKAQSLDDIYAKYFEEVSHAKAS
jgi:ABC-2 type transport system ATP-binding protein